MLTPLTRGSAAAVVGAEKIDCGSPTSCVALPIFGTPGAAGPPTAGQYWDGAAWRAIPHPGTNLYALSCAGPWCLALNNPGGQETRAWAWNGSAWSAVASPPVTDGVPEALDCLSPQFCVAATSGGAWRWDGQAWTGISGNRTSTRSLDHVTCVAPDSCLFLAGERYPYQPDGAGTVERWNGSGWTDVPGIGDVNSRNGEIGCVTSTRCFYVGGNRSATRNGPTIYEWNGSAFAELSLAVADYPQFIACVGGTCVVPVRSGTWVLGTGGWTRSAAAPVKVPQDFACATPTACFGCSLGAELHAGVPALGRHGVVGGARRGGRGCAPGDLRGRGVRAGRFVPGHRALQRG